MFFQNVNQGTWVYLSSNTINYGSISQAAWLYFSCTFSPPHLYAVGTKLPIGPLTNGAQGDNMAASCPDANSGWTWITGSGYNLLQTAVGGGSNCWDANGGGSSTHLWGCSSINTNQQILYSTINCPAGIIHLSSLWALIIIVV